MIPHLRLATEEDSDVLFAWRNDPTTQAASKSTAPVSREDHERWMKFNVLIGYPEHRVLIGDDGYSKLGVVRFDASKDDLMAFDVSITVAPERRGDGIGVAMLREACSFMTDFELRAEARRENAASRKIFERCGFTETRYVGSGHGFVNFVKEPVA